MERRWIKVLEKTRLFAGMQPDQITRLLDCFQSSIIAYPKGKHFCLAGQPQHGFVIVLAGRVVVQKEDPRGKRLIMGIFGPGEMVGEVAAFAGNGQWPGTLLAGSAVHVLFLPAALVSKPCSLLCDAHSKLMQNMLYALAEKAILMNKRISYIRRRGMREKLSAFLYDQYRQTGNRTFHTAMNREEMADYLNVSRPSMSRELSRMKQEALIDYFRSSFTLLDLERLRLSLDGGGCDESPLPVVTSNKAGGTYAGY